MSFRLFLLTSIFLGSSQLLEAQQTLSEQIDAHVQPYLDNKLVYGLAVGVLKGGQVHTLGYGQISNESPSKPDEHTIYEIGSITKVFTAVLLADRVQRGLVRLDDSIGTLVPEGFPKANSTLEAVHLNHLATHVSGLPRMPDNFDSADAENPFAKYDQKKLYDFLSKHLLMHKPGDHWEYSNLGFGLLGDLLASQNGTSYETLLVQRITKPLEMTDTTTTLAASQQSRLAPGHDEGGQQVASWDFTSLAGAGAIRSTVSDLLKFASACLSPPKDELGQAIDLTWEVQRQPQKPEELAGGLGWLIAKDGQTRFHNGQTGGYHSSLFIGRDLKQAVVVLSNTATVEVDVLAENIYQIVAGMDVKPRVFDTEIDVEPEKLQRYIGKYQLVPNVVFTVNVVDKKLMVGLTGQPTFRVYPRSETEWFYKVVEATLTFKVSDDGNCNELELFQNGLRQTAKRINP